ncbi:MAG: RluA family pseudouridine synthase [Fibrobacterales bacterium]
MSNTTHAVTIESGKIRLDKYLQEIYPDYSRTDIHKWIAQAAITVNGKGIKKNHPLSDGDTIEVAFLLEKPSMKVEPEPMDLDIVFEDDDLLVINKPKGLVVHPGNGIYKGTLAAGVLHHCKTLSTINGEERPGIVHRLDKDTSGLMIVAKNDMAHANLAAQLERRDIKRTYRCLVWGAPRDLEGTVDAPIARDPRFRIQMAISQTGRRAVTHYKTLETYGFASYLEVKLETGRTHQIRLHMRYTGIPIIGDPLYNGREKQSKNVAPLYKADAKKALALMPSQALQAIKLQFNHPRTDELLTFTADLQEDFQKLLSFLQGTQ